MTKGEKERVPFARHDHFVGRILVKGFVDVGYFPAFQSFCVVLSLCIYRVWKKKKRCADKRVAST